jgi:hypothetical protein
MMKKVCRAQGAWLIAVLSTAMARGRLAIVIESDIESRRLLEQASTQEHFGASLPLLSSASKFIAASVHTMRCEA